MKFPKHLLQIRDTVFNIGDGFSIQQDLDNIPLSMSFTIPYVDRATWSTANIRKYDLIKLYYNEFDSIAEQNAATVDTMNVEFYGYIDTLPLSEDKTSGIKFTVNCKSIAGLLFEKTTEVPIHQQDLPTLLQNAQDLLGVDLLPSIEVNGITYNFTPKLSKNKYFGETLNELKTKYAFQCYQQGAGKLILTVPSYFNKQSEVTIYDITKNVFMVDYGSIEQGVDSVLILGNNCVGFAIDPISMQLKQGVLPENIDLNINPTREQVNPLIIQRRDIFNAEDAQEIARNKLIEAARNYSITIEVPYQANQNVGDMIQIINSQVISPTQKWIIKKRNVTIEKSNIKVQLVLYSNSIVDFPDDILKDSTGILDTDILNITEKVESTFLVPE